MFSDWPSSRSTLKACFFATQVRRTEKVPVMVFQRHIRHSFGCRTPLCLEADNPDQSCAEVQDLDLVSYIGLEAEVARPHPALGRKDLGQTEDCFG